MLQRIEVHALCRLLVAAALTALLVPSTPARLAARMAASSDSGAAGSSGASAPADAPPVLLRDSLLLTPVEAAGTGLAPEVKVRVTVDPLGRVSSVEMLSIDPSSEYDEAFRHALETTIGSWRYAPAREDGQPVEATLRWTIQFKERAARSAGRPASVGTIIDEAAKAARIYTLPVAKQKEILQRSATLAEQHMDPTNLRRAEGSWFNLVSDSPKAEAVTVLAQNLQAIFRVLDATFRPVLDLYPQHVKLAVYVFWSQSEMHAFAAERGAPEWALGFYDAPGVLAFPLEIENADRLVRVMLHEATHAYADRLLDRPGTHPAPWFTEGLAGYFGQSEIKKGHLVLGSIREGKYVLNPYFRGAYRRKTDTGWSLDRVREAVRKGETIRPSKLMKMGPPAFYGRDISLHYSLSWLLVHYLRHGEPGWAEEEFPQLLLYLAEGYPAAEAIEAVYGMAPEDLDAPFRDYVKGL